MLAASAGFAQLPRVLVDTTHSRPLNVAGRLIRVPADGNLQGALDSAQKGDTIEFHVGATYRESFSRPNESGAAWINVRSSSPESIGSADRRIYTSVPPAPAARADAARAAAFQPEYAVLLGLYSLGRIGPAEALQSPGALGLYRSKPAGAKGGWPMRAKDPADTAHTAALGPVVQVRPLWTFQPNASTFVWRPAVAPDGTIYVTTVSFLAGGVDGRLYALRPDGSVKWQTQLTNSSGLSVWASATPVVDGDGNIYVAWAYDINHGSLTAISLDPSGSVRWRFEPNVALESASHQQPVLKHGVLYAAADTSFFFGDTTSRASLYALNSATGNAIWRWTSPNLDSFQVGPAVGHDGYLYHASASEPLRGAPGYLYRIRPDGTLDWSVNIGAGVIQGPPAIDAQNNSYVGDEVGVAFKYSSAGARLWTYDTMSGQIYYSPALSGTRVTVGAAFAGLHVLDAHTGTRQALFAPPLCYPLSQASDHAGNAFFYCIDAGSVRLRPRRAAMVDVQHREGLNGERDSDRREWRAASEQLGDPESVRWARTGGLELRW
jgi:hypothetical protein